MISYLSSDISVFGRRRRRPQAQVSPPVDEDIPVRGPQSLCRW